MRGREKTPRDGSLCAAFRVGLKTTLEAVS